MTHGMGKAAGLSAYRGGPNVGSYLNVAINELSALTTELDEGGSLRECIFLNCSYLWPLRAI